MQRVGRDVRALFLDRELAEDFVAMDVTIFRLRCWLSRSHRGIFGKRRVTQWNWRRKEFHNGGAVLMESVRLGSSRSRLWQRTCCGITDK